MRAHKIVVLGSMGAGKTTLIRAIAQGVVVDTDVANSDPTSSKAMTTVAMDYADIQLPDGDVLRLYGAPGQRRFDFMWSSLLEGATGVVIMLDAQAADLEIELGLYLEATRAAGSMPIVIGVSHLDAIEAETGIVENLAAAVGHQLPVLAVDARSDEQVLMLMDVLISEIELAQLTEASS